MKIAWPCKAAVIYSVFPGARCKQEREKLIRQEKLVPKVDVLRQGCATERQVLIAQAIRDLDQGYGALGRHLATWLLQQQKDGDDGDGQYCLKA